MKKATVYVEHPKSSWEKTVDQILTEVRAAREELMAEHDDDLHALCETLREEETRYPERVVDLAARNPQEQGAA